MMQRLILFTMKRQIFYHYLCIVVLLVSVSACKEKSRDYSLKSLYPIVEKYNENRLGNDRGMISKGEARIVTTENDFYVVQFRSPNTAKDLFFALQSKNVKPNFSMSFSSVELIHIGENLILNSLEEDIKILLHLKDTYTFPEISNINFNHKFSGFGLGKYPGYDRVFLKDGSALNERAARSGGGFTGSSPIVPIIPVGDLSCRCNENEDSDGGCKSGGKGSTSCSRSEGSGDQAKSCNVSCDKGYYACCSSD
jgi:hypothetical protein